MHPFFHDPARCQLLAAEAALWQGTRFFKGSCARGHGVDCVRYAHALLRVCGAVPVAFDFPAYDLDHGRHSHTPQLLITLLTHPALVGRFALTPPAAPRLPGDLYGLRSGRADHHLAIHLPDGNVTHALEHHGVVIHPASDENFQRRILYILRPVEAPLLTAGASETSASPAYAPASPAPKYKTGAVPPPPATPPPPPPCDSPPPPPK
ncbi:MAG: hypothetical protein LBC18_03360 [Opitutaceae bacterium]|nr:hypothetical protein [Opitutaceae bacterium]